jgi:hypothetical protein
MGKLFDSHRIAHAICTSMAELCASQAAGAASLIVSEEALLADSAELEKLISAQPVWSDMPIIVLSRSGRERLSMSDLIPRLGNVTVVERPVRVRRYLFVDLATGRFAELKAAERQRQWPPQRLRDLRAQRRARRAITPRVALEISEPSRSDHQRSSRH